MVAAPAEIAVVHAIGNGVGVLISRTEDDRLLLRPARAHELIEEVSRHRFYAVGQDELCFEAACAVEGSRLGNCERFSGPRIGEGLAGELRLRNAALALRHGT